MKVDGPSPAPLDIYAVAVRPHPDVVSQRVGHHVVLAHLLTNQIYSLNSTAARLWELLDEGHELSACLPKLLAEYDIGRSELEQDVAELIQDLAQLDLLVIATAP